MSRRAFVAVSALLFAAGAAVTVVSCVSMGAMAGMPMPGAWTPSMAWVRMPGRTWPGAAASFLGTWVAMTGAMMLPSLAPLLWRYRRGVVDAGAARPDASTALAGAGYLAVWAAVGMAAYPPGAALATAAMRHPALARAVPIAAGVVVLLAGALQCTAWKARQLARCRQDATGGRAAPTTAGMAWRDGVRLGVRCVADCAGPTAILLVGGVMDLRVMGAVTVAITAERLAPGGARVARAVGAAAIGAGALLVARSVGG